MRELMFGWEFPPHISGGLGTACFGMTQALVESGEDIIFVLPKIASGSRESHVKLISASEVARETSIPSEPRHGFMEIREIESLLGPYLTEERYREILRQSQESESGPRKKKRGPLHFSGNYGRNLFEEVVRYGEIAEVLGSRERFDLIHIHDWMTVPAGIMAKKASGKTLIYHVHSLEFDRSGTTVNPRVYEIERRGLESADHIIAVSHYTKDVIVKNYAVHPAKISVVHNAVNQAEHRSAPPISKPPGRKIVLFLGRITFQKGPDYFVEAASRVLRVMPEIIFVMAGSGDMVQRMILRVAELGIGMNFHFTGFLKESEVERIFTMSDLYVMPSVSEPFGISPLEAARYDVPVIISRQSGVGEVLQSALKVDFWDTAGLADRILAVLRYPALKTDLQGGGREELKALLWKHAAGKIKAIYRQLLGTG